MTSGKSFRIASRAFATFILTLSALSMTNCGLGKQSGAVLVMPDTQGSTSNAAAEGVFRTTFYPFARTNCINCHRSSQTPFFAADSDTAAYTAARNPNYFSTSMPDSSLLVIRATDGHCGAAACSNQGNAPIVKQAVETWAAAELANPSGGGGGGTTGPLTFAFSTSPSPLPSNLQTGTPSIMRWNLSALQPSNSFVAGAVLEIQVSYLNQSHYQVTNPKIEGLGSPVYIKGLHVTINTVGSAGIGAEDAAGTTGAGWNTLADNVQPSTLQSPLPNGTLNVTPLDGTAIAMQIATLSALPQGNELAISFDAIQAGSVVGQVQPTFASINSNIIMPICVQCHNPTSAPQYGNVDLSTEALVMQYVSVGNPTQSELYQVLTATGGKRIMPPAGVVPPTSQAISAVSTWITNGAPQ